MRLLLSIIGIFTWHATLISTKDNDTIPFSFDTEDNYDLEAQYLPFHRLARSTNYHVSEGKKNESVKAVIQSINKFAAKYFKILLKSGRKKKSTKSVICAPMSMSYILSLVTYGAGGKTAKQLRSVLALPANDNLTKIGFQALTNNLRHYNMINLHSVTSIFKDKRTVFRQKFENTAIDVFESFIEEIDFSQPAEAVDIINERYLSRLYLKDKKILQRDKINKKTSFVLLNYLAFNGLWLTPFNSSGTKKRVFHINSKSQKKIPTMYNKQRLQYGVLSAYGAKFVGLPLEGVEPQHTMIMYIILPKKVNGLARMEQKIDSSFVNKLIHGGKLSAVELYVPKFNIEKTAEIKGPLEKLGLKNMFTKFANFRGIVEKSSGWNGKVFDKIVQPLAIAVSEVDVRHPSDYRIMPNLYTSFHSLKAIKFVANRPFLWIITSKKLGVPFFMGRYTGPSN